MTTISGYTLWWRLEYIVSSMIPIVVLAFSAGFSCGGVLQDEWRNADKYSGTMLLILCLIMLVFIGIAEYFVLKSAVLFSSVYQYDDHILVQILGESKVSIHFDEPVVIERVVLCTSGFRNHGAFRLIAADSREVVLARCLTDADQIVGRFTNVTARVNSLRLWGGKWNLSQDPSGQ